MQKNENLDSDIRRCFGIPTANDFLKTGLDTAIEDLAWFERSPDFNMRGCLCSCCGTVVDPDCIPTLIQREDDNRVAVICERCMKRGLYFSLRSGHVN